MGEPKDPTVFDLRVIDGRKQRDWTHGQVGQRLKPSQRIYKVSRKKSIGTCNRNLHWVPYIEACPASSQKELDLVLRLSEWGIISTCNQVFARQGQGQEYRQGVPAQVVLWSRHEGLKQEAREGRRISSIGFFQIAEGEFQKSKVKSTTRLGNELVDL